MFWSDYRQYVATTREGARLRARSHSRKWNLGIGLVIATLSAIPSLLLGLSLTSVAITLASLALAVAAVYAAVWLWNFAVVVPADAANEAKSEIDRLNHELVYRDAEIVRRDQLAAARRSLRLSVADLDQRLRKYDPLKRDELQDEQKVMRYAQVELTHWADAVANALREAGWERALAAFSAVNNEAPLNVTNLDEVLAHWRYMRDFVRDLSTSEYSEARQ